MAKIFASLLRYVMQTNNIQALIADLKAGKISVNSPIGQGLVGKKVGETAEVKTPAGPVTFEITKIEMS